MWGEGKMMTSLTLAANVEGEEEREGGCLRRLPKKKK